jgi:hypothetical protein
MEERSGAYRVWWGNLRQRDNLKDLDVDGWIILIGASNNTLAWALTEFI